MSARIVALAAVIGWILPQSVEAQRSLPALPSNLLYITTNDPTPLQNAVLPFQRRADCSLNFLGRFPTGGTGVSNPSFRLGTLDSDQSLVVSPDRRFLFAVNSGSDSIAVFSILSDGTLEQVNRSRYATNWNGRRAASGGAGSRISCSQSGNGARRT